MANTCDEAHKGAFTCVNVQNNGLITVETAKQASYHVVRSLSTVFTLGARQTDWHETEKGPHRPLDRSEPRTQHFPDVGQEVTHSSLACQGGRSVKPFPEFSLRRTLWRHAALQLFVLPGLYECL